MSITQWVLPRYRTQVLRGAISANDCSDEDDALAQRTNCKYLTNVRTDRVIDDLERDPLTI